MACTWSVGVTTIEQRRNDLLPQTLASLRNGGFTVNRLFVDGTKDAEGWERQFGIPVTARHPKILVHGSWWLALHELFIRNPEADRFALFQDDFVCVRNLRQYLEATTTQDRVYWNCYTAPSNQQLAKGQGWFQAHQLGKGAVALVFSREGVLTLLSSRKMIERPLDRTKGWRSVDGGIINAMMDAGWREFCHNPSLVMHTGKVSSIDKNKKADGHAEHFTPYTWPAHYDQTSFPDEDFDALSLLPEASPQPTAVVSPDAEYWVREVEAIRRAIADDRQRLAQATTPEARRHFDKLVRVYTDKLRDAERKVRELQRAAG